MKAFVVLAALAGISTSCSINNNAAVSKTRQSTIQDSKRASIQGAHAKALFAALEDAGIDAELVDGHRRIGSTELTADLLLCQVIQNQFQTVNCQVEKVDLHLEVKDSSIAADALDAMKAANAAGTTRIGAIVYEMKNIECSSVPGPQGNAECTFEGTQRPDHNIDGSIRLQGDQAAILYDALESTGVNPENMIDGMPVTGQTQLTAEVLHCERIFDASMTSSCNFEKDGRKLGSIEASLLKDLVDMLSDKETQVAPFRTGAANYRIGEIKCSRTFGYPMVSECSFVKFY